MVWCINLSADTFHNSTYANNKYFIWNVLTLFHCHSPSLHTKLLPQLKKTSIKNWNHFSCTFYANLLLVGWYVGLITIRLKFMFYELPLLNTVGNISPGVFMTSCLEGIVVIHYCWVKVVTFPFERWCSSSNSNFNPTLKHLCCRNNKILL